MKIIISGYGKMGKEIEKAAISMGHTIIAKIDKESDWDAIENGKEKADVVIDFSQPQVAVNNITKSFHANIPIVTGTTGWYDQMDEVKSMCTKENGTLFYAPNFSIGVNLFFMINRKLASAMSLFKDDYKASLSETHHIHKLDSPSGTAIKIADDILENHPTYESWEETLDPASGVLPIKSFREEEVPGTHIVTYQSDADIIEFKHEAKNRSGFARGAVVAAEWVKDKKGVFTMDEMLASLT